MQVVLSVGKNNIFQASILVRKYFISNTLEFTMPASVSASKSAAVSAAASLSKGATSHENQKTKSNTSTADEEAEENPTADPDKRVSKSQAKVAKKKSAVRHRDEEDDFDDDLIPQWLIDEIYAEMDLWSDSGDEIDTEKKEDSEESLDEEAKRLLAEEEKKRMKQRKLSLINVEGAIPKETLKKLSNQTIRQLILHAKKEIERYETENFLFERTIEKLERPEKAIEELHPKVDEDEEQKTKNTGPAICPTDSEEEPEDTGEYVAIKPMDEIHVSTDSFFENMSDNSKVAALNYFQNLGEIAPQNFDVMRFKYGDMVKDAEEDPTYTAHPEVQTRLNTKVFTSRAILDEKATTTAGKQTTVQAPKKLDLTTIFEETVDEDPEYPGFSMSTAKELPLEEKLKFALEEEEDFRIQFYEQETNALIKEGEIQVNIDKHKHAIRLLLNVRKDFRAIMKEARHPVTGKLMAEMILRFKRKMRNQISAEETKARMTIRKIISIKKRAVLQLVTNKESGNAISQIDFEHIMCENQIFLDEMEEMNLSLKYLKQLSGHFFQILKEDQDSIERLNAEDNRLQREIETKKKVMKSFEKTYAKYRTLISNTNARMDDLKRKLAEYHAPKPLEYIRLKACQYEMESDVANLHKKLDEINLSLITARSTFAMYCRMLPNGDQTEFENEQWLGNVRKEVEENDLMALLNDEDEDDIPAVFKARTHKSDVGKSLSVLGRVKTAQTILLAPSRALQNKRKSVERKVYDTDFEYELSEPTVDAGLQS